MRLAVVSGMALWLGTTLAVSNLRPFARPSLVDRLRPYGPAGPGQPRTSLLSVESLRDVIAPLVRGIGARVASALGVTEDVSTRLDRIGSPLDATAFRLHQMGWSLGAFVAAALACAALRPGTGVSLLLLAGMPLLAFLVVEQNLARASEAWQRAVFGELPVVAEQLAMLLSAGYSLGGALNRLASRGRGRIAPDLARVCGRLRQGLSEAEALGEWADRAAVPALSRLVPVLALNREAADLGRLVSEEARTIRRDAHRALLESIERKAQQVWIPVTVAALVPGVIFLAVPFMEALRAFSNS